MVSETPMDAAEAPAPIVVLLVEDAIALRMPVAHFLRTEGYTVIETSSAEEALGIIASEVRIDLLCTDVQMPGEIDGDALARRLALELPELPVILTSGAATPRIEAAGAPRRFVRKPYELDALARLIGELVGRTPPA